MSEPCGVSQYPDAGHIKSRIINGQTARPNEFPWQISLQFVGRHGCGGTILSEYFVLTAAHCIPPESYWSAFTVLAGAHNITDKECAQQRVRIRDIFIHPRWDPHTTYGDIAVIKLLAPLQLSESVVAACLPNRSHDCYVGQEAVISGWGAAYQDEEATFTEPALLQFARIQIVSHKVCEEAADDSNKHFLQPDMYCLSGAGYARNRSACHGDSGGPLVAKDGDRWVVLGATTFGFTTPGLTGCIQGAPFFYRSVPYYLDWIRKHMNM